MDYKKLTMVTEEDLAAATTDEQGGVYSADGKKFLMWRGDNHVKNYAVKDGVEIICDGALGKITAIGCCPFPGLNQMDELIIPNSVRHIGQRAFYGIGCSHIQLPEGLLSIGDSAFERSAILSIEIPSSVVKMGNFVFKDCFRFDEYEKSKAINLNRFLLAQDVDYDKALAEIKNGEKISHWIWYIFPQMKGLGLSEKSRYYGINGRLEAIKYMENPILSSRLIEITQAVLDSPFSVYEIFGSDAIKVRSCIKLFATVSDHPVFNKMIQKYSWN